MFKDCNTLAELNAARTQAVQTHPVIEVNNAYNQRRQEILSARRNYTKINPVFVSIPESVQYCGIPIAGRCQQVNTIQLTQKGFAY